MCLWFLGNGQDGVYGTIDYLLGTGDMGCVWMDGGTVEGVLFAVCV